MSITARKRFPWGPPSNCPEGFSTGQPHEVGSQYRVPDPVQHYPSIDDFDKFAAADWVITEVGTGGTQAISATELHGALVLTTTALAPDSTFLQKSNGAGVAHTPFQFRDGHELWFRTRLKLSDVTESVLISGLQDVSTTPGDGATKGAFFRKADGSADVDFVMMEAGPEQVAAAVATLVDDTYVDLAFFYDGIDKVHVFVDEVKTNTVVRSDQLTQDKLTLSFGVGNGEAASKIMTVDHIGAMQYR